MDLQLSVEEQATPAGIKILEIFDILEYSANMHTLYERLETYSNHVFEPKERLIFLYLDTDFVISDIRFNLYNLQLILFKLSIPNFASIIITSQDIEDNLENLKRMLTNEVIPISHIRMESHAFLHYHLKTRVDLNENAVEKNYISLANKPRTHRQFMFSWLRHNELLDKGFVSYLKYVDDDGVEGKSNISFYPNPNLFLLTASPHANINDFWFCSDPELMRIFDEDMPNLYKNFTEEQNPKLVGTNQHLIQRAFCYVSNETVFNYPCTYTSEKSYKAFGSKRPMISFGSFGILSRLRELGFRTFSDYWSEDYDDIEDNLLRFKKVAELIKQISNLSIQDCKKMLLDMRPILEHNHDLYIDNFIVNQKHTLYTEFRNNFLRK